MKDDLKNLYDVIIVGGGPAGLSAALYMARAKYKVLVLEKDKIGGQITITSEVVNYPGVLQTSGSELTGTMHQQALSFGAEFQFADVLDVETQGKIKKVKTNQGEFSALGIVLALGANPRKLGFTGEETFQGRGVAYCATCDGEFFKNMEIYVIGGGFAAVEEGIFLTKYASHVHIVVRKDHFSCAKTVADKALTHEKITVHFETEVEEVTGENTVNTIVLKDKNTGGLEKIKDEKGLGVFVFAGYVPNTSWLPQDIALENGYIVTDLQRKTNLDGIYAAGDVCIKELRQVVTAVSDGATAATSLEKYVEELHHELNLPELTTPKAEGQTRAEGHSVSQDGSMDENQFIDGEMAAQLEPVLAQFQKSVKMKAKLGTDDFGKELEVFLKECSSLSPKIECETEQSEENHTYVDLYHQDGTFSGVRYETVPGGHEFNSFLTGLYTLSGAGKPLETAVEQRVLGLNQHDIKVFITLSCTMCPDVVKACQRIALENPTINTTIMDVSNHPELRQKYNIMSVPCMIIDDKNVHFGKKQMEEILDILEKV